jgi:hypothetical protein
MSFTFGLFTLTIFDVLLISLFFILLILIIKSLQLFYIKYFKKKNRITDKKYIKDLDIDIHEVNIHFNKMNKHRRKSDRIDLEKIVKPTTGIEIVMD